MIEAQWPGTVGVCEPRRVAALSLANRVSEETGSLVQSEMVGYAVRFDACVVQPRIKVIVKLNLLYIFLRYLSNKHFV